MLIGRGLANVERLRELVEHFRPHAGGLGRHFHLDPVQRALAPASLDVPLGQRRELAGRHLPELALRDAEIDTRDSRQLLKR
jgi:hypothetical protein